MIKNVIFDMGDVIVDIHRDRAVRNFIDAGVAINRLPFLPD